VTARRPARPDERRQSLAIIALLVWIVGYEVGPDLHLALHGALGAHDHHGATARWRLERTDRAGAHLHHHDGHTHRHQGDRDPLPPDGDGDVDRPGPPPADHGAGSAAHRDVAVHPAAPPVTAPAPVDPPAIGLIAPRLAEGSWRPSTPHAARGPPRASTRA
jgi:hypothetical protein